MRIRRVVTASGATAVQLVEYRHGQRRILEHLGSAHDEATLELLEARARQRIEGDQLSFDFDALTGQRGPFHATVPETIGTRPGLLWHVLSSAYDRIFARVVSDEVFKQLVIARIIEPTSKADSVRVLQGMAIDNPAKLRTIWRRLRQCVDEDWRDGLCTAAYAHAATGGVISVCLYDVTTLYFETDEEDEHRRVGFSNYVDVVVMPMLAL